MKPSALIICLLFIIEVSGQVNVETQRTIRVTGYAQLEIEPSSYAIDIQVREIPSKPPYSNVPPIILVNIDSMEALLKNAIDKAGYDSRKLKHIFVNSNSRGYSDDQLLVLIFNTYEYDLKSIKDVTTFIRKVRVDGISGMQVRKLFDLNKTEMEIQLYKNALADAINKAKLLLASAGKNIGEIISIDINSQPFFDDTKNNVWLGQALAIDVFGTKTISTSVSVNFEIK